MSFYDTNLHILIEELKQEIISCNYYITNLEEKIIDLEIQCATLTELLNNTNNSKRIKDNTGHDY